jgi:general transcription factor 3C polypeptide 3 (transcription factor C subunit 4)
MEFNFARVWHSLGLLHLAINGYQKVLGLGEKIQKENQRLVENHADGGGDDDTVMGEADAAPRDSSQEPRRFIEDFSSEAAYALQCIHVLSGDSKTAKGITDQWLVI